jgi:hypothetical protein
VADWPLPADPADYADWLAEARTVPVLRAADPDASMWAWGADQHVRFWSRRIAHETAVYRVDAEIARDRGSRVDPAVAVDRVGEFLENLPRARRFARDVRHLRGDGELIRLTATDRPDEWTIRLRPDGFEWSPRRARRRPRWGRRRRRRPRHDGRSVPADLGTARSPTLATPWPVRAR